MMRRYILLLTMIGLMLTTASCGTFGLVSVMNEPLKVEERSGIRWPQNDCLALKNWAERLKAELAQIEEDPESSVTNLERARIFDLWQKFETDYIQYHCDRFD